MSLHLLSEIPNHFEAYGDERLTLQSVPQGLLIGEKLVFDVPKDMRLKRIDDTFLPALENLFFCWALVFHPW